MADGTGIEWTDATWNPLTGCSVASPGCDHCYAAREAAGRLSHLPAYEGLAIRPPGEPARFTGEVRALPNRIDQPLRWKRSRRIFANSMSDLFHPEVLKMPGPSVDDGGPRWSIPSLPMLAHLVAVMVAAEQHQFQVLTKRPQIMAAVLNEPRFRLDVNALLLNLGHAVMPGGMTDPSFRWPAHLWWGTSIESDRYTFRADHLRAVNGVRWISAEPLLGPLPSLDLDGIDWLVVGGESGHGARPMAAEWATGLRDAAATARVPFLFKQWGEHDEAGVKVGKKAAGRHLAGQLHDGYPAARLVDVLR